MRPNASHSLSATRPTTNKVGPLRNPHNDAGLVGKALTEVGFKLLPVRKDAKRNEILYGVYELAAKARSAGRDTVTFSITPGMASPWGVKMF